MQNNSPDDTVTTMKKPNARPLLNQKKWKDLELDDLRNIDNSFKLPEPVMVPKADNLDDAIDAVAKILGIDKKNNTRTIQTPVEVVRAQLEHLKHLVEKRGDNRERYANYLLPTLESPFEVWKVAYDDGSTRNRYIEVV